MTGRSAEQLSCSIFFDVSETLALDIRTGIQRVVRELARGSAAPGEQAELIPVVAIDGRFHRLAQSGLRQLASPPSGAFGLNQTPRTTLSGRVAHLVHRVAPAMVDTLRRRRLRRRIDRLLSAHAEPVAADIGHGDQVVLSDTYARSSALAAGRDAKRRGATLVALTYDLIPATHPHLQDAGTVRDFNRSVPRGMAAADAVLTISDWCMTELRRFGVTRPIGRFYLGHDVGQGEPTSPAAAIRWPDGLWKQGVSVFLMVGTIDRRKDQASAVAAFERVWAAGRDARLLIIGRFGWDGSLAERMSTHAEVGRRMFIVEDADDVLLAAAFDRASALIQASVVEGFGLPLVEALAHGLPVIAADIPVFRELVGEAVLLYPQGDAASLADAVLRMERERPLFAERARAFRWIDWAEARRGFTAEIRRLAAAEGR